MASALPDWLDHYTDVPAWVLYGEMPSEKILWVNERLARDMNHPREWFIGRLNSEIWKDSQERGAGRKAMAEKRSIDIVSDGQDLLGNWRWLDARLTPIDDRHLLIICEDITARIKLAGLRLVLGQGVAGHASGTFSEEFARQLLEGASLDAICKARSMSPAEVLAKLGRLVGQQASVETGIRVPPPVGDRPPHDDDRVPDWVEHYWDLPGPVGLLDYPALHVLWVNRQVLERNRMTRDEVIGLDAHTVWDDLPNWKKIIETTMTELRSVDSVHQGHTLRGEQQWMHVRTTPVGHDRLLILSEDVTADIRLQALRLLLGLNPEGPSGRVELSEPFARLLLDGASVENIAVALEMSPDEVRGQAGLILGRSH